jgi:hypothetical protein
VTPDDAGLDARSAALDAWAAATFEGDDGARVLAPWLVRWRDEVGDVRGDDPQFEAWAEARTDWALVDMAAGMSTLDREPQWRELATSWVGVFEVWPTEGARPEAWLRDRIGGTCMRLGIPIDLRREPDGPAALWELRVIVEGARLMPCRRPVAYPRALAAAWPAMRVVPDPLRPQRMLAALRRARLRHSRTPRMDPVAAYLPAMQSV